MTVDLEIVERLMVEASLPVPMTTSSDEVPVALLALVGLEDPELVVDPAAVVVDKGPLDVTPGAEVADVRVC